jgi:hypothetical protein
VHFEHGRLVALLKSGRRLVRRGLPVLTIAWAGLSATTTRATTLWYNGDFDLNDAATNENNVPIQVGTSYELNLSLVFNNFVVPAGKTWSLSSIFANEQVAYYQAPTNATWQIRTGMSAGNGGTLVASGDTAVTVAQTNAADGNNYIDPELKLTAAVSGVTLTAGTYWVAIAPDSQGYYGDQSYIETTSGANAVGTPGGNDGTSFLFNNLAGPGNLNYVPSSLDYSEGVVGFAPEPTGLMPIVGLSIAALGLSRRSRVRTAGVPTGGCPGW